MKEKVLDNSTRMFFSKSYLHLIVAVKKERQHSDSSLINSCEK
ncbi:hypothetical protein RV11_GL001541 [Enterococcus phoeniculicola]|nr:hypothetical protein RV11_GL001541 [Enterococcus phoeniculicola]